MYIWYAQMMIFDWQMLLVTNMHTIVNQKTAHRIIKLVSTIPIVWLAAQISTNLSEDILISQTCLSLRQSYATVSYSQIGIRTIQIQETTWSSFLIIICFATQPAQKRCLFRDSSVFLIRYPLPLINHFVFRRNLL